MSITTAHCPTCSFCHSPHPLCPVFHALTSFFVFPEGLGLPFNTNISPEMQNIINAFVSQSSSVAFRQWVSDGKKVPMEEAIHMVGTLLEKGVQAIITPNIEELS